jgi:hypothetical protein
MNDHMYVLYVEILDRFSPPGTWVADMGSGSGTYTNAAVLSRRNALALDFDVSQAKGFYLRLVELQQRILREHKHKIGSQETKEQYRRNIESYKFVCNINVNSLKSVVRDELEAEFEEREESLSELQSRVRGEVAATDATDELPPPTLIDAGDGLVTSESWESNEQAFSRALIKSVETARREEENRQKVDEFDRMYLMSLCSC